MDALDQQQAASAVAKRLGSHRRLTRGTSDVPWDTKVRKRIQASMIVNRLTNHIKGLVELSTTQVRAAEILLRKVLPDLATVELQAGDGGPILIVTGIMRPDEPKPMIEQDKSANVIDVTPAKADTSSAILPSQAIDKPSKLELEQSSTHKSTHDDEAK